MFRRGMIMLLMALACCLLWGSAYAYVDDTPTRETFSVGWDRWARQLIDGMRTSGNVGLSLNALQDLSKEEMAEVSGLLDQLLLSFSLQYGKDQEGVQSVTAQVAGQELFTLEQAQQEGLVGISGNLFENTWLTLPSEVGDTRDTAQQLLSDVVGMNLDTLVSLGAYFAKPTETENVYWRLIMEQWESFQRLCAPYSDEGTVKRSMSGTDPHTHCTYYSLNTDAMRTVVTAWFEGLYASETFQTALSTFTQAQRTVILGWLKTHEQAIGTWSMNKALTMRVYLDGAGRVVGIAAEGSVQLDGRKASLSMTYTRKTSSKTKETHSFSLAYQPGGKLDGIKASVKFINNSDDKARAARSLTATVSGRALGQEYEGKLSYDYENKWGLLNGTVLKETIKGEGEAKLSYAGTELARIKWAEDSALSSVKDDPLKFQMTGDLDFTWTAGKTTVTAGTVSREMILAEPVDPPVLIGEGAMYLASLEEDAISFLKERVNRQLSQNVGRVLRSMPLSLVAQWMIP